MTQLHGTFVGEHPRLRGKTALLMRPSEHPFFRNNWRDDKTILAQFDEYVCYVDRDLSHHWHPFGVDQFEVDKEETT